MEALDCRARTPAEKGEGWAHAIDITPDGRYAIATGFASGWSA